jgi:hypothetical protein
MKTEKGICLLLLIFGHALVSAELRGTAAKMGDHELKSKPMESSLGEHSLSNTRTLQTGLCSDYQACVYVFGGLSSIPPGAMCCPTIQNEYKNCCGAGPAPTTPALTTPAPTTPDPTTPAPTTPDIRDEVPTENAPTIPAPTSTTPASDSSCSAHPGCAALAGGADKLIPGSRCCPNPYGQFLSCCYA